MGAQRACPARARFVELGKMKAVSGGDCTAKYFVINTREGEEPFELKDNVGT